MSKNEITACEIIAKTNNRCLQLCKTLATIGKIIVKKYKTLTTTWNCSSRLFSRWCKIISRCRSSFSFSPRSFSVVLSLLSHSSISFFHAARLHVISLPSMSSINISISISTTALRHRHSSLQKCIKRKTHMINVDKQSVSFCNDYHCSEQQ